jgi:hypothetical protein
MRPTGVKVTTSPQTMTVTLGSGVRELTPRTVSEREEWSEADTADTLARRTFRYRPPRAGHRPVIRAEARRAVADRVVSRVGESLFDTRTATGGRDG